jgi:hypothetical protein
MSRFDSKRFTGPATAVPAMRADDFWLGYYYFVDN